MTENNERSDDLERLETLAEEAYNVMRNAVAGCDCMQSVVHLKRFIKARRQQRGAIFEWRGQSMGYHVFPFFSDLLIRHSTEPSLATKPFDDNTIAWLIDKYFDFPEILQLPGGTTNVERYVPEWLIRTAFEQLAQQEMTRTLVPRMLYYYRTIPAQDCTRHSMFVQARDEVLRVQFRVDLDELLLCTFVLGVIADSADRFTEDLKTNVDWMRPYFESDALAIVREQLALTRSEYRERANEEFGGCYRFIRTEPKVVLRHPLVRMGSYFVCSDPHLLLARMTKYLHDTVYQYFADNDRIQEYSGSFGDVFKDYIGILLKCCFGENNVLDIDQLPGLSGQRADWVVVAGEDAAIVECKAQRYPKELKKAGDIDLLKSFFDLRVFPAAQQAVETERQWSTIVESNHRLESVRHVHKFVVLEEHFQFANVLEDFLPNSESVRALREWGVFLLSALDVETLLTSNYHSNFQATFVAWQSKLKDTPTLGQHIRRLPRYQYDDDNCLDREFNSFFHRG